MDNNLNTANSQQFWDTRYQNNETGWDMNQVSPPLKNYIDTLTDTNLHILIPGCGNAYEAGYLLSKGFTNVTLIDIAPTLVNALKERFAGQPINIIHGNFFEHNGQYDLMLEQTFFCAINPALRSNYVEKTWQLLKPHGRLAGLLFDTTFPQEGPPFGGSAKDYRALFAEKFTLLQFDACQTSIAPRLGKELFVELEKK